MGQQFSWAPWLRVSHEATIKVLAGAAATQGSVGGGPSSPLLSGCWQGSVLHGLSDWGLQFLADISKRLPSVLCHLGLSIGQLSMKAGCLSVSKLEKQGTGTWMPAGGVTGDHPGEAAYLYALLFVWGKICTFSSCSTFWKFICTNHLGMYFFNLIKVVESFFLSD